MYTTFSVTFGNEPYLALASAIQMGALSDRQATLRTLIENNRGTSAADTFERELRALESGAWALLNAKREDR